MTADDINSFQNLVSAAHDCILRLIIHYSKHWEFGCFDSGVNEDSGVLGCDAVLLSEWLPTFAEEHTGLQKMKPIPSVA